MIGESERGFFNNLKHAFMEAIPSSMSGSYLSSNFYYRKMVSNYYPSNGYIDIGNMGTDKANYSKDIANVFRDYKIAAKKEIDKQKT